MLYTILMVLPIFGSGYMSLLDWNGIGKAVMTGFSNYSHVFIQNYGDFWRTAINSFLFAIMCICIQLPLALILSLVISSGIKGEGFFRTTFFIPVVISGVAIGALFLKFYNYDFGLLNTILDRLGLGSWKKVWLGDDRTALLCAFLPLIWQYIGYHMLLMYSAIKQVPAEVIESAKIDGASRFQTSIRIIIPLIVPMLEVCVIFAILGSLKILDMIYVLTTNGMPDGITRVPSGYMILHMFQNQQVGIGSTAAMFIVAECFIFTLLIRKVFHKLDYTIRTGA